ncbi:hypothetical protein FP2506_02984 [Fulvimarina pelagi HTCC2506]|uniref:Uncharacterized protein n=2 Tax=Fulvimarina pelagi TaxID=217511 RepID=Q0G0D6_9HYPH|nr:DUF5330 domain-containing protein [Fulvimarina pelagi]EAU40657.1 hypothetical protein FP2506_02984 [Fulvimarina pelagi HTCC2506]BAT31201.1 hypothetical protein [Fulvimarina pelagi]
MIRFVLKSAFVIGLASLLIPGLGSGEEDVELDPFQGLMGMRAAVEDVMGFCTRAPEACEVGSQLGQFALDRVESGFAVALDAAGPSVTTNAAEGLAISDEKADPGTDWAAIHPALLNELFRAVETDGRIEAGEISPELVDAVRRAADLAGRRTPADASPAVPSKEAGTEAWMSTPTLSAVPTPRSRPGL